MKELSVGESVGIRVSDMLYLAEKRDRPVFSHFMNEAEQRAAIQFLSREKSLFYGFWGGDEACVRKILCISTSEVPAGDYPVFPVSFSFRYESPAHKDFLGAFMALGLKREHIGDIFTGENAAAAFFTKTARDAVTGGITSVGHTGVKLCDGLTDAAAAVIKPADMKSLSVCVSSLRADCVVSAATGLSRAKAAEFIRAGHFFVNYEECSSVDRLIARGDVLTLRRYGKYTVASDAEPTKKGRIRLSLNKYI